MADLPFTPITLHNDAPVERASSETDLLNLTPLAKEVAAIAVGTAGPFTMAVTARWGYGKTSMLGLVRDLIRQYGEKKGEAWTATHATVWFNAWQYEREEEPLVPLLLAIQEELARNVAAHENAFKEGASAVLENVKKLPGALLDVAAGVKLKGKVGTAFWLELLTGIKGGIDVELDAGKIREAWRERFAAAEETGLPETTFIKAMREFDAISKGLTQATEDEVPADRPKIVVFVDDLDRCHPDAALRLLDGIKLVLNQPGFVFVLALDKTILEEFLVRRYELEYGASNPGEVGRRYVDKIIQLEIPLPPQAGRFAGSREEERKASEFRGKGYLERIAFGTLEADCALAVADTVRPCAFLSPRDVARLLLRLRLDLALYDAVGETIEGFTRAEIAVAATLMRLVEGAFDGAHRSDFLDLVADGPLGERLWKALVRNFAPDPEEISDAPIGPEHRPTLTEAVFAAVRAPRGLTDALRANGERWLNSVALRRRLLEFLAFDSMEVLPDTDQSRLVQDAVRRALNLREGEPLPQVWSGVLELSFDQNLDDEGLRLIGDCTDLTSLSLRDTGVTDLAPLAGLAGLTTLSLWEMPVTVLSTLAGLAGLATLSLAGTPVTDLAPLADFKELTTLSVMNTSVTDLKPLAGLKALTTLSLWSTRVTDLAPLSDLAGLTTLDLSNTPVTDLAPLSGLAGLTTLHLWGTPVTNLNPLAGLAGLATLSLGGTPVTEEEKARLRKALPNLRIVG